MKKTIPFTKEGYEKVKDEFEKLKSDRPDAVGHLKKAREMGDLSENGYYKASRAKLSFIDARLFRMKIQLKYAVIVDGTKAMGVDIGSKVTLTNKDREVTYHMVGDLEA